MVLSTDRKLPTEPDVSQGLEAVCRPYLTKSFETRKRVNTKIIQSEKKLFEIYKSSSSC